MRLHKSHYKILLTLKKFTICVHSIICCYIAHVMTKVNIFGFGEIEAVLKRLLLLTIESSVQLHFGQYDDNLVGSMHEQMNANAVTWCVESDKEIMQVYDDMTSELTILMNITSNVKINVQHKMSLSKSQ